MTTRRSPEFTFSSRVGSRSGRLSLGSRPPSETRSGTGPGQPTGLGPIRRIGIVVDETLINGPRIARRSRLLVGLAESEKKSVLGSVRLGRVDGPAEPLDRFGCFPGGDEQPRLAQLR